MKYEEFNTVDESALKKEPEVSLKKPYYKTPKKIPNGPTAEERKYYNELISQGKEPWEAEMLVDVKFGKHTPLNSLNGVY